MIGAVECDDPPPAGHEECRSQPDLDCVRACDAELRGPRQRTPELGGDFSVGEIAQRMRNGGARDRLHHAPVAVAERSDAEPG